MKSKTSGKHGRSDKPVLAKDAHLTPHLSKFGGRKKYGKQEPDNNFDKDVKY
jgi:hypothetical protein